MRTRPLHERGVSVWTLVAHAGTELNGCLDAAWRWKTSWLQDVPPDTAAVTLHRTSGTGKASEQSRWPSSFVWVLYILPLVQFNHSFSVFTSLTITDKHKQVAHWHFLKYLPKPPRAPDVWYLLHTMTSAWVDPNHHYSGQHNCAEFAEQKVKSFIIKLALYIVYTASAYFICWRF